MQPSVIVAPVQNRSDLKQFLHFPWHIYRHNPVWVPPLLYDLKRLLNPRIHPFHQHAQVQYFLARRGTDIVGRIAAIVNHQYVQFHNDATGFFGFFESVDDQAVATALLDAAAQWVVARGMQRISGPMNFSTNEECGLLVDGFQYAPMVMMPYNPPFYTPLLEAAGYTKAKDLLAYLLNDTTPPERLVRGVQRLQRNQRVTIRPIDKKHLRQEVDLIREIYQSAWERNWGFIPMTEAEADYLAAELRWVEDPELCLIAEVNGEPAGFALALPDYNQALKYINGRLFPFGLFKLLWYRRRINAARVLTLGLKPGFRRRGLDAMLYLRLWEEAPKLGYPTVECSWILDDNWDMRRGLERMGGRIYKTYRIYEKGLGTWDLGLGRRKTSP